MAEQKLSPEDLARQKHAEKRLEELEDARDKAIVPIEFSAKPYETSDETTPFESLINDFSPEFTLQFKLRDKVHKWHCVRLSHFDIFPDSDEGDDDVTMRALYRDAVTLICKVVKSPSITPELLKKIPTTLVTRIARGIEQEIMPRYREDADAVEVSETEEPTETE